jgi:hypothetical protein
MKRMKRMRMKTEKAMLNDFQIASRVSAKQSYGVWGIAPVNRLGQLESL